MTRRGLYLFLAVGFTWGIPYFLIAIALQSFSTPSIVWLRVTIGSLFLLPVVLRRKELRATLREWKWVLLFAALEMIGPWYLITEAERSSASSLAGLMMTTIPFIAAFITGTFLGDRAARHPVTILGLVLGFAGVLSLVGIDAFTGSISVRPVAFLAVSAVCYAVAPIVANRTIPHISGIALSTVSLAMVSIAYLPFAALSLPADIATSPPATTWLAVVVLGVLCSALAFVLYFGLIKEVGPRRSTLITYVNLFVAAVLGIAFLGEPVTIGIIVGLPLVVTGSYLASRDRPDYRR